MTMLILKRASASRPSGEWSDDDYDVLADGAVVGRSSTPTPRLLGRRGCGRSPSGTTRTARRRTAMSQHGRPRWRRSRKVGGASKGVRI
jgi:hypothetical protein